MMTTAMAPKEEKVATQRKATRKEEKAPNTTLLETTMTMITLSMAPKGGKAARNATMTRFLAQKEEKVANTTATNTASATDTVPAAAGTATTPDPGTAGSSTTNIMSAITTNVMIRWHCCVVQSCLYIIIIIMSLCHCCCLY